MKREQIEIQTPFIKLDSFLKLCGVAGTGGHAKVLIQDGLVAVDGQACVQRGKKLYPGAVVALRDHPVEFEVAGLEH